MRQQCVHCDFLGIAYLLKNFTFLLISKIQGKTEHKKKKWGNVCLYTQCKLDVSAFSRHKIQNETILINVLGSSRTLVHVEPEKGLEALCRNSHNPPTHGIRVLSSPLDVLMATDSVLILKTQCNLFFSCASSSTPHLCQKSFSQ